MNGKRIVRQSLNDHLNGLAAFGGRVDDFNPLPCNCGPKLEYCFVPRTGTVENLENKMWQTISRFKMHAMFCTMTPSTAPGGRKLASFTLQRMSK
jgi:hypothetical protein